MSVALSEAPWPADAFETDATDSKDVRLQALDRDVEESFYRDYSWCLNPCPTVREAVGHLRTELDRLFLVREAWQRSEIATNVFLLGCALLNGADDYLHGVGFKLPRPANLVPFARVLIWTVGKVAAAARKRRMTQVRSWRDELLAALDPFLRPFATVQAPEAGDFAECRARLSSALAISLPADFQRVLLKIPTAFRGQDLTHFDVLMLGRRFVAAFPDRSEAIAVVGLRTTGSYFAPLLRSFLLSEGFGHVESITIRPDKGMAVDERRALAAAAKRVKRVLLVDDPPGTGDTLALAVEMLRKADIPSTKIVALLPIHPSCRDWRTHAQAQSLAGLRVLSLDPKEWYKERCLDNARVEERLRDYFRAFRRVEVVAGGDARPFHADLERHSEENRRTRLKRILEVRLTNREGRAETRHILAKSVGWGWLGYHAFLTARRLAAHVPPCLGLRDGILFTEWLPQDTAPAGNVEKAEAIASAASYIAARARFLSLDESAAETLKADSQHRGNELLAKLLSRAYGSSAAAHLKRGRIRQLLSALQCPCPTLIDGRMRRAEWIRGPFSLLKTDIEHHGLGKNEMNVVDPAFDLADAILALELSREEEVSLIAQYTQDSGDTAVKDRLFLHKLLAGSAAMTSARANLGHPRLTHRHQEFNRDFVRAWNFLTIQSARLCGSYCQRPETPSWRSPLAVLDVDGVLDRRIFGFPSTTAAGVQALALFHTNDWTVAINSARSVMEIEEYCRAYGLAGGVAEYGSYIWDAVAGRGRCLVSDESLRQLEDIRRALSTIPGAFVNDTYRYSIRAYTYEESGPVPLPTLMVQGLLAQLQLDRLGFQQTSIDTAIVAREADKGRGLESLLRWLGIENANTVAVGDSEPDLAMFRVAGRCFAPAQISCRHMAQLRGCRIARRANQAGLLEIARELVQPGGGWMTRWIRAKRPWPRGKSLFLDMLTLADGRKSCLLLKALLDPKALQVFVE